MRLIRGLLVVVLIAIAGVAPPSAAAPPEGATWQEMFIKSSDGTALHADLFLPEARRANQRHPVLMTISPYFTEHNDMPNYGRWVGEGDFFGRGYAYVQVSLRGFGGSGGCGDFGGPGEQADVKAAIEWAAQQPWSNGRVGMFGVSYDAWTQVMALATKPKGLAAAVISSPLLGIYRGLYMNGAHYAAGWYSTPSAYAQIDLESADVTDVDSVRRNVDGVTANPGCYADNQVETLDKNPQSDYYRVRDLVARASGSTVPVLWSHGFLDANTKPDNFLPVWRTLRGPHRAWFGQFVHRAPNEMGAGRDGFILEAMNWFDRHVARRSAKGALPAVELQDNTGRWRGETAYPPADAKDWSLPLRSGTYSDAVGPSASNPTFNGAGTGAWTFSQPLPHDVHLSGEVAVQTTLSTAAPQVTLVALVYDVPLEGRAALITRGAYSLSGSGTARFALYPQDWKVKRGHRIGVLLTGSDDNWWTPTPRSGAPVSVTNPTVTIPFLRYDRLRDPALAGEEGADVRAIPTAVIPESLLGANTLTWRIPPRLVARPRR